MPDNDASLREQLVQLLRGGHAHVETLEALKDFPPKLYGAKPENSSHSAWEVLEHMRIALRDIWDFSTNDKYVEKKWPDDYWPATAAPPSNGSLAELGAGAEGRPGSIRGADQESG